MSPQTPEFKHLKKPDGALHSVCLRCYLTVIGSANARGEDDLRAVDALHVCEVSARDAQHPNIQLSNMRHYCFLKHSYAHTLSKIFLTLGIAPPTKEATCHDSKKLRRLPKALGWLITRPKRNFEVRVFVRVGKKV